MLILISVLLLLLLLLLRVVCEVLCVLTNSLMVAAAQADNALGLCPYLFCNAGLCHFQFLHQPLNLGTFLKYLMISSILEMQNNYFLLTYVKR